DDNRLLTSCAKFGIQRRELCRSQPRPARIQRREVSLRVANSGHRLRRRFSIGLLEQREQRRKLRVYRAIGRLTRATTTASTATAAAPSPTTLSDDRDQSGIKR